MNVSSLLKRTAGRYPSNIAIVEDERKISYERLWQEIEALSNAFRSIGIRKNTRVAILLPNCKEFIYSFFALLNINAIAVPLKLQMTCWELAGMFKNSSPNCIILDSALLNKVLRDRPALLMGKTIAVKEGKREIRIFDKHGYLKESTVYALDDLFAMNIGDSVKDRKVVHTHPKQIASINYTYRGYGYPLGAMLTHNHYIHGAIRYIKLVEIQADMRILLLLPVSYIFPLVGCVFVPFLAKATCVMVPGLNPKKIFQAIEKHKINSLACTPSLYEFLLKHYDAAQHDISSLQFGISGGDYMPLELHNRIKTKMGVDIIQGYGLTETLPVTCNPRWGNRPETLGITGHDVKIKIVDESGVKCRPGEIGEIAVQCPSLMLGYYKAPKETKDAIKGEWFHTGDYGRVDQDGYVYFEGLKKGIVKVGGNAVDIAELRTRMLSVKQIKDVQLDIQKDGILGHKIIGTVVPREDMDNFDVRDLRRVLREQISVYKVPGEFVIRQG